MQPVFLCPHTRISGGVKVIFRLANGLYKKGIDCSVAVNKLGDKDMLWLGEKVEVPVFEAKMFSRYTIPEGTTHMINFGDGTPFGPIPDIPHLLYLQHFGVHNYERECINLSYPYAAIITVSQWLARLVSKQFRHQKVYVNYSGIDDVFQPIEIKRARDFTTLGCLYHNQKFKNVDLFIATMNKLHSMGVKVHGLFLSARQIEYSALEAAVFPYTCITNPPVHFVPIVYNTADIWVAPSYAEGFGLCPIEAMACGIPTVIVKSFGLDEHLIHGENCLSCDNDKTHLVSSITALIQDVNLKKKLVDNGIILAKKFTWEKAIDRLIKILKAVQ